MDVQNYMEMQYLFLRREPPIRRKDGFFTILKYVLICEELSAEL
jgi:hypothetical protein